VARCIPRAIICQIFVRAKKCRCGLAKFKEAMERLAERSQEMADLETKWQSVFQHMENLARNKSSVVPKLLLHGAYLIPQNRRVG
jgi:hypothetical protein